MKTSKNYLLCILTFLCLSLVVCQRGPVTPSGPNPAEPPELPTRKLILSFPIIKRFVPSGPNSEEPPECAGLLTRKIITNRDVPSGPNPEEPPESPMFPTRKIIPNRDIP